MSDRTFENSFEAEKVIRGAVAGALGGLLGGWAMNHFHAMVHPPEQAPRKTSPRMKEKKTAEEPATVKTATAISQRVFHHRLSEKEKKIAEPTVHYGFGASAGALYGAAAEIAPAVTTGRGIAYGLLVWLFGDEMAVPALGLSKPPTKYPVKLHGEALAAHLIFGVFLEAGRRAVKGLF